MLPSRGCHQIKYFTLLTIWRKGKDFNACDIISEYFRFDKTLGLLENHYWNWYDVLGN